MCTKGSPGGTGASSVWMRTELWSFPVRRSMRRGSSSRLSVPAGQPRGQSIRERRRERRRPENGVTTTTTTTTTTGVTGAGPAHTHPTPLLSGENRSLETCARRPRGARQCCSAGRPSTGAPARTAAMAIPEKSGADWLQRSYALPHLGRRPSSSSRRLRPHKRNRSKRVWRRLS